MTSTASTGTTAGIAGPRASRRGVVAAVGVAVVLVVIALVAGRGSSGEGPPLSPSSTGSDGLRALVLLVESFGGEVHTDERVPSDNEHVALLVRDSLRDADREALRAWVTRGNTLVVADAASSFAAPTSGPADGFALARGACDAPGLDGVEQLSIGQLDAGSLDALGGVRYDVRHSPSCFGDGDRAYVVVNSLGSGSVVSVGAPNVFANAFLDRADDSVLAMRLLQPDGPEPVAILQTNVPRSGTTTLFDLVADRVWQAILQLGVAFLLYALWRARRLGRPVVEPQPVAIAGSELVRAVGSLELRTHAAGRAAASVRQDVARMVRERYGLPAEAPPPVLAGVVAERTGLERERVAAALEDTPVTDDAALVAITRELDTIRKEVLHGSRR